MRGAKPVAKGAEQDYAVPTPCLDAGWWEAPSCDFDGGLEGVKQLGSIGANRQLEPERDQ